MDDEEKSKKVGRNTFIKKTDNGDEEFVKYKPGWIGDSEAPRIQAYMYERLRNFLRMPQAHLVGQYSPISEQELHIQPVRGERADSALITHPQEFSLAISRFASDESRMWQETAQPVSQIDPEIAPSIIEGMREDSIGTLESFLNADETRLLLDRQLKINGRQYPTLREMCLKCLERLKSQHDPIMVLGQGDEHLTNLFVETNSNESNYEIIDPRLRLTRRSPAHVVNNFLGSSLLFVIDYQNISSNIGETVDESELRINYLINDKYTEGYQRVLAGAREMVNNITSLDRGEFMTKEYLFANLIRSFIGRVADKNREVCARNKLAHLAVAVELYNDFEGFLGGRNLRLRR